ncbi:MAG: 4'-phosphopantetheinyl transferase superfamily protein [Halioglobus sp.]|nr:4'-phosphopantetheinyl transferase superfamily protein [Halioglobus sp.]
MTALSASASSVSESLLPLAGDELHLWLGAATTGSEPFVRQVLSRYVAMPPAQWRFSRTGHGKPALVNAPRPLAFNVSDSRHWRVCAVTAGGAIGVDLEYCDPRRDALRLARRYFRVREVSALLACAEHQRNRHFYAFWTLKEACIKSRGATLGAGLEHTGFRLQFPLSGAPGGAGGIGTITRDPATCERAHYCLLQPLPGYQLATCWLRTDLRRPRLRLLQLLSDDTWGELTPTVRAVSGKLANNAPDGSAAHSRALSC